MKKYLKSSLFKSGYIPLLLIVLLSTLVYSFIGIQKHNHFQTFAWDTAFFSQELYFIDQLKAPFTSLNNMNALGDHFQITFIILGFIFYKIWASAEVLFFIQSFSVSLSAIPLFLITQHFLKKTNFPEKGRYYVGLSIILMYLTSVSVQGMLTDEFHNDPLAVLPFLSLIYFVLKKNNSGYWISLAFLLLTKETYGLLAVLIGIFIIFLTREYKKAFITAFLGLATFYLLVYQLMPLFSGTKEYFHFVLGNRPGDVISEIMQNPQTAATEFFDNPQKIKTILVALFSFGFFPFISNIAYLILPAGALALRFYDDTTPLLYVFNNHYSAPFIPLLAVAAVYGISRLPGKFWRFVVVYTSGVAIVQNILFHGPINSMFKRSFYEYSDWQKDAHDLIKMVPEEEIIASQNSLLSHLAQRDKFYLLPNIGNDAKYLAVDLSDGPNKFAPLNNASEMKFIINRFIVEGKYKIIWQKNQSILLKRVVEPNSQKI